MKKTIKIISILIILVLVFILGYSIGHSPAEAPTATTSTDQQTASIMFDFGNGEVSIISDVTVYPGETLATALLELDRSGQIQLKSTDYGGDLGLFLESINGVGGDTDKWWQYWVNNAYSTQGVSSRTLYPGDVVLFKYSSGSFE